MRPRRLTGRKRDASAILLGLGWAPEDVAHVLELGRTTIYRHQKELITGIMGDEGRKARLRRRIEAGVR